MSEWGVFDSLILMFGCILVLARLSILLYDWIMGHFVKVDLVCGCCMFGRL